MGGDPLLSAKLKIERANAHIDEIRSLGPGWTLGNGYRFVVHQDSQPGGQQLMQLKLDPLQSETSVIVGETIYQLRSTLDVATVAMARANGIVDIKHIYFPIANSLHELTTTDPKKPRTPQGKIAGLSDRTKKVIYDLRPYPNGNDDICGLNTLRNEDAHIELTPIAANLTNLMRVDPSGGVDAIIASLIGTDFIMSANLSSSTLDGFMADVTNYAPDLSAVIDIINKHFKIAVDICFANSKAFDNQPVISTLQKLSKTVSNIIELFESNL